MNLLDIAERDVAQLAERRALDAEGDGSSPSVSASLTDRLISALANRDWTKREQLARMLGCSVRAVRDAASESRGHILSGNEGLKLTREASAEEVAECLGRFTSQIHEMSRRVVEIRAVCDLQGESETASR